MSTGTGTSTKTTTLTRTDLLIKQINIIVQGTTGSLTFHNVIKEGIKNKWIKSVIITGLTKQNKIRQQILIEIDWNTHIFRLKETNGDEIAVNIANDERNWISQLIGQIIDGFNEIKEQGDLEATWAVRYTPEAKSIEIEVDKKLGLKSAETYNWEEGRVEFIVDQYRPKKLDEASFTWKVVTKS